MALAAFALPALGADDGFNPLGDGSEFNNSDFARDTTSGCENCLATPPHDWNEPAFDLDWSLALRGAYVQATGGSQFEASAVPSLTLTHDFLRGSYAVSASAEITRSSTEEARIAALRAGFSGAYQLDEATGLTGKANFALARASASAPGTLPGIAVQPLVVTGDAEGAVSREFGPLVVSARANAGRSVYGVTTMADTSLIDNSAQNNWVAGTGLRVGYRVTPILTAFIDGSVGYQWYDAASPLYLVKLDAMDLEGRTGLSAKVNDVLEAEISIGYGQRRFLDPSLGTSGSMLYDASLTFRPDETVEMRGAFSTSFGAPGANSGGTARLEYAATGDLSYRVNPWLRLRASAGWRYAEQLGTTTTEMGHNAGAGLDYLLNEFATLTADYAYSWSQTTPNPAQDEHRVTLGVTFSR